MSDLIKVAVIICSTRKPRVGDRVAEFVKTVIEEHGTPENLALSLVDVADYGLPVYDEAVIPAMVPTQAQFAHEHSKAWSAKIAEFSGYVFVTPEYNYGIPGGIKNAIDYLYNEWQGKPVLIISYGVQGGSFASDALKQTLEAMKLFVCPTRVMLSFSGGRGPDLFAAITGVLGEETKASWNTDKKASVLAGYEELKNKLIAADSKEPDGVDVTA
ncbi:flavoprotein-like protein [Lipomyces kononenkoae]|uniref:Flavoprotein-like protein n=1 Tax=Lipomyces kononenkoae TaxID=34357 RepID=A0ACC3SY32_LIPKO